MEGFIKIDTLFETLDDALKYIEDEDLDNKYNCIEYFVVDEEDRDYIFIYSREIIIKGEEKRIFNNKIQRIHA